MRSLLLHMCLACSLLISACATQAQLHTLAPTTLQQAAGQTVDVKVAVVDAMGTPRPDVVVVMSVEGGNNGRWLHREGTTNNNGSVLMALEKQFLKRKAVVAILDQAGRALYTTEKLITGVGQRVRIELD